MHLGGVLDPLNQIGSYSHGTGDEFADAADAANVIAGVVVAILSDHSKSIDRTEVSLI